MLRWFPAYSERHLYNIENMQLLARIKRTSEDYAKPTIYEWKLEERPDINGVFVGSLYDAQTEAEVAYKEFIEEKKG